MAYVTFVSDERFEAIVKDVLNKGIEAKKKTAAKFGKNVIDPFAAIFEMGAFNLDFDQWKKSEVERQTQKTLSNQMGVFHQKFLGSVTGWTDLGVGKGIDLLNTDKKIIAEIKNKHNTLKGSDQVGLYDELTKLVMPNGQQYKDYTAYYVYIVPKRAGRVNKVFTPSDKKTSTRCSPNDLIRQIDGDSFYALVTGVDDALEQVFLALPKVIKACMPSLLMTDVDNTEEYFKVAFVPKPPPLPKSPKVPKAPRPIKVTRAVKATRVRKTTSVRRSP